VLPTNFITDLEKAIAGRSAETGAMLHQITDLFMTNAGHYSPDELKVYDEVLQRLVASVDVAARAKLAARLAPVESSPSDTLRALATDESIEVAEPILSQSTALSDDVLMECIAKRGNEHMLAIATRSTVSERISGELIAKGDRKVIGAVVNNQGAAISEPSFRILVEKGTDDDWLAECVASRKDIPERHLRKLVARASDIVRERLIAASPRRRELIDSVMKRKTPVEKSDPPKDYRTAELVVRSRPLTEATVNEFARARQTDEVAVAIAQLSGLTPAEIDRLISGTWSSPIPVVLKAIGFHLSTLQAIYNSRLKEGEPPRADLVQAKAEFIALQRGTAERILRFYRVRKTTTEAEKAPDQKNEQ